MHAIPRLLLLPLLMALATMTRPARGQLFFPGGIDVLNQTGGDPDAPDGRLIITNLKSETKCHFEYKLRKTKSPTLPYKTKLIPFAPSPNGQIFKLTTVEVNGTKNVTILYDFMFDQVDEDGKPCTEAARVASRAPAATALPTQIPVSNDADSFDVTCDNRFAVVVGANSATPVSLVDLAAGAEVDTFAAESNVTYAATFDDGESVVVLLNIPPANDTNRIRRLKIVNGKLVDTGESLAAGPAGTSRRFKKVFAVPGSKVGVALAESGTPNLVTFSIPGLQVLDSNSSGFGDSAAVSCGGDKVYVRGGSQIRGYTLDPVTGDLGDTPFLTINGIGQTDPYANNFGNVLAVSRDGTLLIVPEGTAFPNSPATPRTTYFDTTTGARAGFFDAYHGASPTIVSTYDCCADIPVPAVSTVLFKKGDTPPGADGGVGKPPADAVLASCGVPALDADGTVAFTGNWTSATTGRGSGVFTSEGSLAIVGGAVPALSGATFKAMTDPLINGGRVAFLATLAGVPKAAASAVLSDAPAGTLAVIARTGTAAPGADGATFKSFGALGLDGASVSFLATLAGPKAADMGLWAQDATHPLTLVLREGGMVGVKTIKTLISFKVGNGSPGQGRGWLLAPAAGTEALALVIFTDQTQAVVTAGIDGTVAVLSQSGPGGAGGPDITGAGFASYGVPAQNAAGQVAFRGTLAVGPGNVTKANASGIFAKLAGTLYTPSARLGSQAGETGGTFRVLKDPVLASDGALAFAATLQGGGLRGRAKTTLWWQPSGGELELAAQGGAHPPGTPSAAQWKTFTSLGIAAGHGPLFAATLVAGKGGVKAATASGVWATAADGALGLFFRTGQTIDGKRLQSFKVLNAGAGSLGATRSFNDAGQVAWLATFTDQSTAIVVTEAQ